MTWQSQNKTGYRDGATKLAQLATSKGLTAAVVGSSGGTGYTIGDILTITGVGAAMDATLEVLTLGASNAVATVRIRNMGAFSNRAVSATISAGGANYAVGDILRVEGGTYTQRAKFQVATLSGSAAATVTLFEGGGAYTVAPTNPASTTKVGPLAGTGSGATLTLTMSGNIATTNVASTGGTGTGANFNLTLTATGWTELRDRNDYSFNGLTDEKEVVLQGTSGGATNPLVGWRTYTGTVGVTTNHGMVLFGMDAYNDGLTVDNQQNVGPSAVPATIGAVQLLMFDATELFWFSATGRRLLGAFKCQGGSLLSYTTFYLGLGNPFGTETEYPYAMVVAGTAGSSNRSPDAGQFFVTGLTEQFTDLNATPACYFRHPGTGIYTPVMNANGTPGVSVNERNVNTMYPVGRQQNIVSATDPNFIVTDVGATGIDWSNICLTSGAVATAKLFPAIGTNESLLVPATIVSSPDTSNAADDTIRLELDGVFWVSGTKSDGGAVAAEDSFDDATPQRYRVFTNAARSERYSFLALKES